LSKQLTTVPLLDAASTLFDLCGLFNPVAVVSVEPTPTQPSRCWTLGKHLDQLSPLEFERKRQTER
jgi:hypothetical protein